MKLLRKMLICWLLGLGILVSIGQSFVEAAGDYRITDFVSQMVINQDTSLSVTEIISVDFAVPKHGIFRVIPVVYSAGGKTIRTALSDIEITDGMGEEINWERSRLGQSVEFKIGDADRTLTGPHIYQISYRVKDVLQVYDGQPELYWNVTGLEWDTEIENARAVVESPYASVKESVCYAGYQGSKEETCEKVQLNASASFFSKTTVGQGKDFTIVVGLDQKNSLQFPGRVERLIKLAWDNMGYLLALVPISLMGWLWYKFGRDQAYKGDNIYYQAKENGTKSVSPWERHYLPMVYSPIKNLTPAQVGTILDEQVDLKDLVAEIMELARLGFLAIHKLELKKRFLGFETDYLLVRNVGVSQKISRASGHTRTRDDGAGSLKDYQKLLLDKLFDEKATAKAVKRYGDLKASHKDVMGALVKSIEGKEFVFVSSLKNIFYVHLEEFKEKLYADMEASGFFARNPQKTRLKWVGLFVLIDVVVIGLLVMWAEQTNNFYPIFVAGLLSIVGLILAWSMASRTPIGHALFRQIKGLKYFIDKGQWRQEIAEKHLFLEETLPLAISLGVVKKLTAGMADLNIEPPKYVHGFSTAHLASDLGSFQTKTANTLVSSPSSSGKSSWSGGSGFSGGSGGGFGGGGGGSW